MMLFIRLSWPANVPEPPYCGVRRVMSLMRPDTVGSTASSSRVTDGRRAGTGRAEHRARLADDRHRLGDAGERQPEREVLHHAERERDVVLRLGAESRQRGGDRVGPADAHARRSKASVGLRDGLVGAPRRLVHGGHRRSRNDGALRILDDAGDGARGHALGRGVAGRPERATLPGGPITSRKSYASCLLQFVRAER